MNSRRGSHFRKGEVFKAYNVLKSVCMFGMAAHSKVKSSDDIIINVLETDGRSLCFVLCFHSIGNQSTLKKEAQVNYLKLHRHCHMQHFEKRLRLHRHSLSFKKIKDERER